MNCDMVKAYFKISTLEFTGGASAKSRHVPAVPESQLVHVSKLRANRLTCSVVTKSNRPAGFVNVLMSNNACQQSL
jgi:hypothetical protein